MKTRVIYCLTSEDTDIYAEQLAVSLYSLKKNSPNTAVVVLMDSITYNHLTVARKQLLGIADEIKSVDVGEGSGYYRSRMLKTTARMYVDGPILYIDCDTIILRPLDELDEIEADLAAVQDANLPEFSSFHPTYTRSVYNCNKFFSFKLQNESMYFSGGAIFAKDTPLTHKFFSEWNKHFIEGHNKGVVGDQQSLAYTNFLLNHPINEISGIWNCQMYYGVRFMPQAKILHYFAWAQQGKRKGSIVSKNPLQLIETFSEMKKDGVISDSIKKCILDTSTLFDPYTCMVTHEMLQLLRSNTFRLYNRFYNSSISSCFEKILGKLYYRHDIKAMKKTNPKL